MLSVCVCLSVCMSVTFVHSVKTNKYNTKFITLVAGERPSLLMVENKDEVYDKKPQVQRYAEDNVRQW